MISYIKGELSEILPDVIVVEANGIGYNIYVPGSVLGELPSVGSEVKIYTYMNVKEDECSLFGFLTRDDLSMFKMLICVNGIGPKAALGALSNITADDLRFAVLADDVAAIKALPGIGPKTAQKIIDFVISDPPMSAETMAYKIGISSRAVEKQIAKLRSMGILSREGADFGGYWRIVINPQTEK